MRPVLARLLFALFIFAVTAATAAACLPKEPTTLSTTLSGGGKEGAEITVSEGTGVKDQATLSGKNAAEATGTVKYAVFSDSKCEKLVTSAGESSVTKGKVSASEEKKLEAGATYYWQAVYSGDSIDEGSTSPCNEVLTVKAKTSLSTSLSGGGKEGAKITVPEETEVKDQATLSGTKSSAATGTVKYEIYKDKECKELVGSAGEVSVSEGKVPASSGEALTGGIYYWKVVYEGDSLHEKSVSACGTEVLTVSIQIESCMGEGTECKLSSAGTTFTATSEDSVLESSGEEHEGETKVNKCNVSESGKVVDPTSESPGDNAEISVTKMEFSKCTGPALTAVGLPWTVSADLSTFPVNREFEWSSFLVETFLGCKYKTEPVEDLMFKKWDRLNLLDLGHVVYEEGPWYCFGLRSFHITLDVVAVSDPNLSGATSLTVR